MRKSNRWRLAVRGVEPGLTAVEIRLGCERCVKAGLKCSIKIAKTIQEMHI